MLKDKSKKRTFTSAALLRYPWIYFVIFICSGPNVNGHPLQGLIYAKVTLTDGVTQQGILQWNKRQLFWEDIFETRRKDTETLDFLSTDEIKKLSDQQKKAKIEWGFMHVWENNYPSKSNKFSCRFGDIASMTVTGEKEALLTIKNGRTIRVKGDEEFGDVGNRIHLIDPKGQWHRIEWKEIRKIDYVPTPGNALNSAVRPLFGTVKTDDGQLTGHIKWDQDETMTSSLFDGKNEGKKHSIPFGKIQRIKKIADNTCELTLVSGQKMTLSNSDDVGPSNHGLTVFMPNTGSIWLDWDDFKELTLGTAQSGAELLGYGDFKPTKALWAEVKTTTGESYKGELLYDLDERWECEMLEGHQGDPVYSVAFDNIRTIERKDEEHSSVSLQNGQKLLLKGHADVNDTNWGVLVWVERDKPKYIAWNRVKIIKFR